MMRDITGLCSSLITRFVNAIRREREGERIYFNAKSKYRLLAPHRGITSRYYLDKIQLVYTDATNVYALTNF